MSVLVNKNFNTVSAVTASISAPTSYYTNTTSTGTIGINGTNSSQDIIINEDSTISVGDLSISGKMFNLCLREMLDIVKEKYPEEFI
jgi:hypothetical protein